MSVEDPAIDRYLVLSDIVFEQIDDADDDESFDHLKELRVLGLSSAQPDGGLGFPLERDSVSNDLWKTKGWVELPMSVDQVDFALIGEGGQTVCTSPMNQVDMVTKVRTLGLGKSYSMNRVLETTPLGKRVGMLCKAYVASQQGLPEYLNELGDSAYGRFEHTNESSDLTEAIALYQRALELFPENAPDLAHRLTDLSGCFRARFRRTGEICDIEEAVSLNQKALKMTPQDHPDLPSRLANLADSFYARFQLEEDLSDLNEVISLYQKAVAMTPNEDPDMALRLTYLGDSFYERFRRNREHSDITQVILVYQQILEITPDEDPDLAQRQANLGESYYARFLINSDISDLNEAISLHQGAVKSTREDHPELPRWLSTLGDALRSRFRLTVSGGGQLSDIIEATAIQRRALAMTPEGHPAIAEMLDNLGIIFRDRFTSTGDLSDIVEAISLSRRSVETTPADDPDLARRLGNLAKAYFVRLQYTGDLSNLTEAISLEQRALEITPDDHPELANRLTSLASSFHSRFQRTGENADLAESIVLNRRALDLISEGDRARIYVLGNLGSALYTRFRRMRDISDLEEAISLERRAMKLAPEDHYEFSHRLNNLGTSLHALFKETGDLSKLSEAITLEQRALAMTPNGHFDMVHRLSNLAGSLRSRYGRTGEISDLDEAIALVQRAATLSPPGHSLLPARLYNLGNLYADKHNTVHGTPDDMLQAISCFKSAATTNVGPRSTRLLAARSWAQKLQLHSPRSPDVLDAFDCALSLVATIAGLDQTVQSRYTTLRDAAGVALDAASLALSHGRVDKALEWLEQGRCLVWGQLTNLRTSLDDLRAQDKRLADMIEDISKQLDTASSSRVHSCTGKSIQEKISLEADARNHTNLAKQRDELVERARAIPGFETFLLPPSFSNLQRHLPPAGYVIIVNVHADRCDALALSPVQAEPLHIPLPSFSFQKAMLHRNALNADFDRRALRMREASTNNTGDPGTRGARLFRSKEASSPIGTLLKGLWNDLAKPIFDALGLKKVDVSAGDKYPRLWWCPTGVLSFLPIHAAGIYKDGDSVCALDYAVPSYTPTITSLTTRVRNCHLINDTASGLLITSQPNPTFVRAAPIPGTTTEVRAVYAKVCEHQVKALKVEGDEVTIDAYLKHMEEFSSVHLACHGSQNASDPLSSRFLFHDGPLELRTIIKQDLDNADLAFLSACQTSTGEEKLADEAVHLAAGMLAAGYRRVVATMWPIGDHHAPRVAQDFYDYIFDRRVEGSLGTFDGSLSAEALHHAIQGLRSRLDNSDESLLAWAPYVHWGY